MFTTTKPFFPEKDFPEILDNIRSVLESKELLTMGNHVTKFEREFSKYIDSTYGIATNSCSSALEATLKAADVTGSEVIVPTQTFIATGASVINAGGKLVLADINENNYNVSFQSIKEKTSENTKAIIVVHFGGLINEDIWDIKEFCSNNNIFFIEDCAHAHGASIDGVKAGNIGDAGCFSFYATKILTTGEGGLVTTNSDELYEKIASIRNRGIDIHSEKEIYARIGSNYRMTEICAILGLSQLKHLDEFLSHRQAIAKIYDEQFDTLEKSGMIETLKIPHSTVNSYWRYTLKLDDKIDRTVLKEVLLKNDIRIDWPYDPPLHLQPAFNFLYGKTRGLFPIAEKEMKRHICLPMNMHISLEDAENIGHIVSDTMRKKWV